MDSQLFKNRKILAALAISIVLMSFVLGTAYTYQINSIKARETFGYENPVTVDTYKHTQDNSLLQAGWKYLGVAADGRHHYQWQSNNKIMNAGMNWLSAKASAAGGAGNLVYIALSTDADAPVATETSLDGGETTSGGLTRASATTLMGTAASGTVTWTLVYTFTALTLLSSVQKAGLFTTTGADSATMFAQTTFAAVNLASGDTLTLTWSLVAGGN